jgi:protein SCO1/2
MTGNRRNLLVVGVALALLALGFAAFEYFSPKALHGEVISPPSPRPDFTLQAATGPISLSDFRGKLVVLYFGYTSCPDLCPLTLSYLRQTLDSLGGQASEIQVVFVSVDGLRDTPEKLSDYVHLFRPDFVGVTGTEAQIDSVTKEYGIFYLLYPPDENGFYSVDHTATIQVLDREQNLVLIWPHGIQPEQMASDLKVLLKKSPEKP